MRCAIGMDVGGTSAKLGLVTMDGSAAQIAARETVPTGYHTASSDLMTAFQEALDRLLSDARQRSLTVEGLGVGMPGLQDSSGRVQDCTNLPALNGVAVAKKLGVAISLPSAMDNDLNVMALGEARFGDHPQDGGRLLVVALGTGIGAGLVAGGQLLRPTHGSLGDPGHIQVNPTGRRCRCGAVGCLETEVAGWAMEERGGIDRDSVSDRVAGWLAMGLASFCVLYEPDVIVLGGQNALRGGDRFRVTVQRLMRQRVQPRFAGVPVRLSVLGDAAGILGAAASILP